jgi:CubicO group peptidase (beta-lactamase class C family)
MRRLAGATEWAAPLAALALACAGRPSDPAASAVPGNAAAAPAASSVEASTPVAPARPTEVALRAHLEHVATRGVPNYENMAPQLADAVRSQPGARETVARLGALQNIVYKGPGPMPGVDVYEVTSDHGFTEWHVGLAPDGKIGLLGFRSRQKPPEKPPTRDELVAQMKERLERAVAADEFAGVVSISKGGQPLFEAAYGLADRERKIPNELDTKFRIGSMNKMFTAVSVLQLVEARKLSLDDSVGEVLAGYPNAEVASKVTLEHLLLHTGGTGDIFGPEYRAHRLELKSLEDYLRLYGQRVPRFEPGSRFEYSNYGFVLLGLVIAQASGKSYYDYVRDNVYRPAGMTGTDSPSETQAVEKRSRGYMRGPDGALQPNDATLPPRATSAGGGLSTVRDLQRFAQALLENRLLSTDGMALLTAGRVTANGEKRPGFFRVGDEQPRSFGHGGGAPGMNGDLRIFPDSGYVIAVLSNLDPPAASNISEFAAVRLPAE